MLVWKSHGFVISVSPKLGLKKSKYIWKRYRSLKYLELLKLEKKPKIFKIDIDRHLFAARLETFLPSFWNRHSKPRYSSRQEVELRKFRQKHILDSNLNMNWFYHINVKKQLFRKLTCKKYAHLQKLGVQLNKCKQ